MLGDIGQKSRDSVNSDREGDIKNEKRHAPALLLGGLYSSIILNPVYFVYILQCADKSLYTGITTDLARRLAEHKDGTGSNYTRARGAKKIVYSERHPDRSAASRCEAAIKKLSRKNKLALIQLGK